MCHHDCRECTGPQNDQVCASVRARTIARALFSVLMYVALVYSHAVFVVQCTACPLARLPFLNGTECIAACPALVQQGVCTSMCTPGFFADRQQCVECDETCRTCTGGGHLQCTSCNPGRFLLNGECRSCSGCTQCGMMMMSLYCLLSC